MRCRLRNLAAFILILVLISGGRTTAALLDGQELVQRFGSALVEIEEIDHPSRERRFGFVIHPDGYIITVSHVLTGLVPNAIGARSLRKNALPHKLTEIARLTIDEKDDLVVLKADSGFEAVTPPSFPSADPDFRSGPFTVITGSVGFDEPVPVNAILALEQNHSWEVHGSINPGMSGSPVLDKSGNLVALVLRGAPGQGIAYMRELGTFRDSLRKLNILFLEAPPAPEIIAIYLTTTNIASTTAVEVAQNVKAPLIDAFRSAKDFVTPELYVYTNTVKIFDDLSKIISDDENFSTLQKRAAIEKYLNKPVTRDWLKEREFAMLYLLIVDIERTEYILFKPALLVIDNQISKVVLREFEDTLATSPSLPTSAYLNSQVVKLLHIVFRKHPSAAANGLIMADCFVLSGFNPNKDFWLYSIPTIFSDKLREQWHPDPADRSYEIRSASMDSCRMVLGEPGGEKFLRQDHLSEILLKASILPLAGEKAPYTLRWEVEHPWNESKAFTDRIPISGTVVLATGLFLDQDALTETLAQDIVAKWHNIIAKIDR